MMQSRLHNTVQSWLPQAVAASLWAVAAALALSWFLHLPRSESTVAAAVSLPQKTEPNSAALARALGHTAATVAPAPEEQKRFQLIGVISAASGKGSVLMAVDGQPPKVYRTGQSIDAGWVLHATSPRAVTLKSQGQTLELRLPGFGQD